MDGRSLVLVAAAAILSASMPALAQSSLNLDFETRGPDASLPEGWFVGGNGYVIKLDETDRQSGKVSLRFVSKAAGAGFGVATSALPVKLARGKKVCLSGAIKTDDGKNGYAGLWLRVDGPEGKTLAFDNMSERIENGETKEDDRGAKGTSPWKRYTIEVAVDRAAININFGCLFSGTGTARFDALAIELDGRPYEQLAEEAKAELVRKPEQIAWLKASAVPFDTADAGHGFSDLTPLKAMIGDAHIVSLGEATHGTAEFFKMKHRLTEFLASEMGFTVFAIEASMPEAFRVNDYVLRGEGDPNELLKGMYFWTWNTQEVLDMILWMREFNKSGKGKIEFLGFDMQEPKVAAQNVRTFVAKADPDYRKTLDEAYAGLASYTRFQRELRMMPGAGGDDNAAAKTTKTKADYDRLVERSGEVLEYLTKERDRLVKAVEGDAAGVDWAIQNARIVVQAVKVLTGPGDYRDRSMAENVDWILAHRPTGTKIVLWAHNFHVSRQPGAMGSFLAERHKNDMVVSGFAFHEGKYTAVAPGIGLKTNDASASAPGSVEWAFHEAGLERAILDLRKVDRGSSSSNWLAEPINHRSIGALAMGGAFFPNELTKSFDLLIFFDQTTASVLLPPHRRP
jgi:erythromycin esterase